MKTAKTKIILSIGVWSMLILIGCASAPQQYNYLKEKVYAQPFDTVWQKTIEWFGATGIPIKNLDKSSGFIATEYNLRSDDVSPDKVCDCGSGTIISNPTGNFNIVVKKIDQQNTKVIVNAFFKAQVKVYKLIGPDVEQPIDCNSTGRLERELLIYLGN
jgi:uncharacterized lipoprotein